MLRQVIALCFFGILCLASTKAESLLKCYQCNSYWNETCKDEFDGKANKEFLQDCNRLVIEHINVSVIDLVSYTNCTSKDNINKCLAKSKSQTYYAIDMPELVNCTDADTVKACIAKMPGPISFVVSYTSVSCRKAISSVSRKELRTSRSCGYLWSEDSESCYNHAMPGNPLKTTYCSCTDDACNFSMAMKLNNLLLSVVLMFAAQFLAS